MYKPRYIVASTLVSLQALEQLVNERMDAGYTPLGGLSVTRNGKEMTFFQAMIIDRRSYPFEFDPEGKKK